MYSFDLTSYSNKKSIYGVGKGNLSPYNANWKGEKENKAIKKTGKS